MSLIHVSPNTIALRGSRIELKCTTNVTTAKPNTFIHWEFLKHGGGLFSVEYIYMSGQLTRNLAWKYEVVVNSNDGTSSLFVKSVDWSNAGVYNCTDDNGLGSKGKIELAVIDPVARCAFNALQPEVNRLCYGAACTCHYRYFGPFDPSFNRSYCHCETSALVAIHARLVNETETERRPNNVKTFTVNKTETCKLCVSIISTAKEGRANATNDDETTREIRPVIKDDIKQDNQERKNIDGYDSKYVLIAIGVTICAFVFIVTAVGFYVRRLRLAVQTLRRIRDANNGQTFGRGRQRGGGGEEQTSDGAAVAYACSRRQSYRNSDEIRGYSSVEIVERTPPRDSTRYQYPPPVAGYMAIDAGRSSGIPAVYDQLRFAEPLDRGCYEMPTASIPEVGLRVKKNGRNAPVNVNHNYLDVVP